MSAHHFFPTPAEDKKTASACSCNALPIRTLQSCQRQVGTLRGSLRSGELCHLLPCFVYALLGLEGTQTEKGFVSHLPTACVTVSIITAVS